MISDFDAKFQNSGQDIIRRVSAQYEEDTHHFEQALQSKTKNVTLEFFKIFSRVLYKAIMAVVAEKGNPDLEIAIISALKESLNGPMSAYLPYFLHEEMRSLGYDYCELILRAQNASSVSTKELSEIVDELNVLTACEINLVWAVLDIPEIYRKVLKPDESEETIISKLKRISRKVAAETNLWDNYASDIESE